MRFIPLSRVTSGGQILKSSQMAAHGTLSAAFGTQNLFQSLSL